MGVKPVGVPSVCLVMIVRNEAAIIERCLEAAAGQVDCYCISDTGSTDGTPDKIRAFMEGRGVPGQVTSDAWTDFGTNRTLVVRRARGLADYLLLLDADFVLKVKDQSWRPKLSLSDGVGYYLYYEGPLRYRILYLVSGRRAWRYVGVTHEHIEADGWTAELLDNHDLAIQHRGDGGCKADKFERDAQLLEKGLRDEPDCVRYLFYLGNTYFDMCRRETAKVWYKKRIAAGGWDEEVYYAKYRLAECTRNTDGMEDAVDAYLAAWRYRPQRLEALYRIVRHYRDKNPKLGYCYAMMAYPGCLRFPGDGLFVDDAIHRFMFVDELAICSYYAGHHLLAVELNKRLLSEGRHPNPGQLRANMKYSTDALSAVLPKRPSPPDLSHTEHLDAPRLEPLQLVDVGMPRRLAIPGLEGMKHDHTSFVSSTPSLLRDGDGYVCNVRLVNYHYDVVHEHGWGAYPRASTVNEELRLDLELKVVSRELIDLPGKVEAWHGIEDVRLHRGPGGNIRFMASLPPPESGTCIGLYRGKVQKLRKFESCEKNWVFAPPDQVIYSFYPLSVGKIVGDRYVERSSTKVEELRGCRGGSPGEIIDDELWFVTHLVSGGGTRRRYAHKVVALELETLKFLWASKTFKLSSKDVEYCGGLVDDGDDVLLSFSEDDCSSKIGRYCKAAVRVVPVSIVYWRDPNGHGNFGDELSPFVAAQMMGAGYCVAAAGARGTHSMVAIGSSLHHAPEGALVWGTGVRTDPPRETGGHGYRSLDVRAVRGPRTASFLRSRGFAVPKVIGDPALLLPKFYEPRIVKRLAGKVALVPHLTRASRYEADPSGPFALVDVTAPWRDVVDQICSCKAVVSSSLHGLIVADAYSVPNVWLKEYPLAEGTLKFLDYFESQKRPIEGLESIEDYSFDRCYCGGNRLDLGALADAFPFR